MSAPLAIDLYCGLGGWTEGLLAEGYDVIGFDIERHVYGEHRYPAQLVLQDVRTLHGVQFKDASLIVASSPCQEYSYMAMPWTRAKEKVRWYRDPAHPERLDALNELFHQPARIQREACEAACGEEQVSGYCHNKQCSRHDRTNEYLANDLPVSAGREIDIQNDIAALLRALGLSDHARPISPHAVVVDEIIPAVTALRSALAAERAVRGCIEDSLAVAESKLAAERAAGEPWPIQRVAQDDPKGCAVACLAMVSGRTYADVKASLVHPAEVERGLSDHTIVWWLQNEGYFIRRSWPDGEHGKPIPTRGVAIALTHNEHWIVLDNGQPIDPARDMPLAFYPIRQVIEIRAARALAADPETEE